MCVLIVLPNGVSVMLDNLTGIFNPYSEFNIEVEPQNYCSFCGIELKNTFVLGKEFMITESSVFCSALCRDSYSQDRLI
jgi:hypothetical protein